MLGRKNPSAAAPVQLTAIRVNDATNPGAQRLRPATVFASATNYTMFGRFRIVTDRNDYSGAMAYEEAGHSTAYNELITNSDGTTMAFYDDTNSTNVGAMTVGTWYTLALRCGPAGAAAAFIGAEGAGSLTKVTFTAATNGTRDQITIGATNFQSAEYWSGDLCDIRMWDAVLSDAELGLEFHSATLVRSSNILGWWKCENSANKAIDSSGMSNTLNVNGTGIFSDVASGPIVS
jgi:hypothetical protein